MCMSLCKVYIQAQLRMPAGGGGGGFLQCTPRYGGGLDRVGICASRGSA